MKTTFLSPILMLGALTASALIAAVSEGPVISKENAGTFYRDPSFTRLTKEPYYVAPLTAILCAMPGPQLMAEEMEKTGPHYQAMIYLYANQPVVEALKNKAGVFPENSMIIKEKLDDKKQMKAVGGMIKGYDFENGDWEYFYFSKEGGFASGRMQSCVDCHRAAETTDHVYSLWKLAK